MSLKEVANDSATFAISNPAISGTITVNKVQLKAKVMGSKILLDGTTVTVTNITTTGYPIPDPGPYTKTINVTATKVKAGGKLVLRVGDKTDSFSASPQVTNPNPPPPTFSTTVTFTVDITNAGQTKVKAV